MTNVTVVDDEVDFTVYSGRHLLVTTPMTPSSKPAARDETDDALMVATSEGDAHAFTVLVERYERPIRRMIGIIVGNDDIAADLTQETFTKVWSKRRTFDKSQSFRPWVFAIARNIARSHLRWARVRKRKLDVQTNDDSPLKDLEQDEERRQLQRALQALPKSDREIIALRFAEDLAFKEIASILNIRVASARVRAHRALERLKAEVNR